MFEKDKLYIGYDLGLDYGEISYFTAHDKEIKTVISREDATLFHFPSLLVKSGNYYYAGMDAVKYKDVEGAIVFEQILELAITKPSLVVNGMRYETINLLVLFLKLTLKQLSDAGVIEKAQEIVFTTYVSETKTEQRVLFDVLGKAAASVFSKKTKVYLQTRSESIYYYLFSQLDEIYENNVLICEYQQDFLTTFYIQIKGQAVPYGVQISNDRYDAFSTMKSNITQLKIPRFKKQLDDTFYQIVNQMNQRKQYQVVYLIGDGFKGDWLEQSLDILCEKARVFQGNNMYSLGACYQMLQVMEQKSVFEKHKLIEQDAILYEIGMHSRKQGFLVDSIEPSYDCIFVANTLYYECQKLFCVMLEDETQLVFVAKHAYSGVEQELQVSLAGIPNRKMGETKLEIALKFTNTNELNITVRDIGIMEMVEGSNFGVSETYILE